MTVSPSNTSTTSALIRRVMRTYLSPYLGQLCVSLAFMLFAAAMTALFAGLLQPVLDDVLVKGKTELIFPIAGGICLCFVLRGISTYLHTILMNKIGQRIVADIQKDLFRHFMRLDLGFFHAHASGELLSRVVNDVNVMRMAVSDSLTGIGKSVLTLAFLVALMFWQDWKLALLAFSVFPLAAGVVAALGSRLRTVSGRIQSEMGGLSEGLSQIFQGIRIVKAYGQEAYETDKAAAAIDRVCKLSTKSVRIGSLSTPFNEGLVGLAVFGIVAYGGYQTAEGNLTPGELVSFIAAFSLAYEPMKKLARLNNSLQLGLGAAERVFDMLDREILVREKTGSRTLETVRPEISFSNVSFRYAPEGEPVLDDVSFAVRGGTVTALVGPSGSGKTTAMNLLLRFYDVSGGTIAIDGTDIREFSIPSLRRNMALVSQDVTIFDDTILANIAYGRPEASEEEIVEAAKAAAADAFIRELPHGYRTTPGENGVRLSGGQRQRIAIARAILRDAPILLLDEATSALDSEAEQLIQAALTELQKNRTTLVIAHRLSTVRDADQIVVLDKGRVAETGTHDSLIEKNGIYAGLSRKLSA